MGASVKVYFLVQEGQIRSSAAVQHAGPNGLGLKFSTMRDEDRRLPYVPSHIHDAPNSKQRRRESRARVIASRQQPDHSRFVRTAGMPEKRLAQSKVVRMVLDKKSAVA